jgi:CheY-like chemotaxis protein
VDDDPTEREILVELLTSPRRSVEAFESADAAWSFVQHNPIDLAFIDHVMPGRSGAELAGFIKSRYPQARVIMCTGYLIESAYPHIVQQAERILRKPLDLGEVLRLADAPAATTFSEN